MKKMLAVVDTCSNRRAVARLSLIAAALLAATIIVPISIVKATAPAKVVDTKDASTQAARPVTGPAQTVCQRLGRAIELSRELAGKDEEPDTPSLKHAAAAIGSAEGPGDGVGKIKRFPRDSHVARYTEVRPWSWDYARWHTRYKSATVVQHWPSLADAPALRDLLEDKDPAMRAIAAEVLATLHQPEDVGRLGRLLADANVAAPVMGYNAQYSAAPELWPEAKERVADKLNLLRSWQKDTVALSAGRAIRLMTGEQFSNEAAFDAWWKINHDGRNCLWYWQQRMERELEEADDPYRYPLRPGPGETLEQYVASGQALRSAARAAVHKTIAAQLRELSPEVEAKVRLLAASHHAGGDPITGSETQFWPDPPALRLTHERLLDLLDGKDLWPDVPWHDKNKESELHNLLVERLGLWAHVFFRRADVPRLQAALKREHENLWWSGQAAMIIGISRLLPPAGADNLDDPETRDGALRQAVLHEHNLFVRGYCAKELVRVGLPANAPFLTSVSFSTEKDDPDNRITQDILQAMAESPRTPTKRKFLIDLLSDQMFDVFWTRKNTQMGMDMCRQYGIWAVNAYAGRELIDNPLINRLVDPAQSAKALIELHRLVAQLGQPSTQPATKSAATQAAILRKIRETEIPRFATTERPVTEDQLRRRLTRKIAKVNFDMADFGNVIDWLSDMTDVRIVVKWDLLQKAGIEESTPVTYRAVDVTVTQAIDAILAQIGGMQSSITDEWSVLITMDELKSTTQPTGAQSQPSAISK